MTEFEPIKKKVTGYYRRKLLERARTERKFLETPTKDLELELAKLDGYLKGLGKMIEAIDQYQIKNEFPELV